MVKADGLAAVRASSVAKTVEEAEFAVDFLLSPSGTENAGLVLEEVLEGEEVSYFALCDGATAVPFGSAQDHNG